MRKFTKKIAAILACTAAASTACVYHDSKTSYQGGLMGPDDYAYNTQETTFPVDSSQIIVTTEAASLPDSSQTTTTTEAAALAEETATTDAIEK